MPEAPFPKVRLHPYARREGGAGERAERAGGKGPAYAELQVTTNFSFLRGASHPEEMVERAADLGHVAAAVTDLHTMAGVVRAHVAAKALGFPLAVGCRVELEDALARPAARKRARVEAPVRANVLLFATDVPSYGRLCSLLTEGKRRSEKGECRLSFADVESTVGREARSDGVLAVSVPPARLDPRFTRVLARLRALFPGDRLFLASSCLYGDDDRARLYALASLSEAAGVPLVATNDVHYHDASRRRLQDVLVAVREGVPVEAAGFRLFPHAERRMKSPEEMARLFAGREDAVARAAEVALRASAFSLEDLRYRYPKEVCPDGLSATEHLGNLVEAGAKERYPTGVPPAVRERLAHELSRIAELGYEPYFLTVFDLVAFARSRGILCQGRGAAANSAVCYCLGITSLDPERIDLLFERFVSKERREPPDIDVDFEHERREEVIQYLYRRYGRERAALCAEVITYRWPSAVRDVGKAMGLSLDAVDRLAKTVDGWWEGPRDVERSGLSGEAPAVRGTLDLAGELLGFPRHLSQHVGGFVITEGPLSETVPVENAAMPDRTVIEWDKDDLDAMGMLKVDVLGLGMLTCIRKAFAHAEAWDARAGGGGSAADAGLGVSLPAERGFSLATIPPEDPEVYDRICAADTVGVFQIESRAQMSMLPRLRPRSFYDLVIEVAIVRPGPIQGRMVHPYLRRRSGEETVSYPSPEVERVLRKTLGVPLFQEQAMSLAIVAAGFTPGEADRLRRAMAAWKRKSKEIHALGTKLVAGMVARGLPKEFAERCFAQIQGFSEYGFPESHAASFALLVYVSAWLKRRRPAAFAAALLDSQPMGFYAPAQIVRDAKEHGVEVLPVDVNRSGWECRLEDSAPAGRPAGADSGPALRLGMRLVKGLSKRDADAVAEAVAREGPFSTTAEAFRASGVSVAAFRRLAAADAFSSMGLSRQAALWQVRALRDEALPLFPARVAESTRGIEALPRTSVPVEVAKDYRFASLSLKAHPVSFLRDALAERGAVPAATLSDSARSPHGAGAAVAGAVLVRQRPSTAKGVVFFTLEDETGIANLIVRPDVFERHRDVAVPSAFLLARGRVERQGAVVHLMVSTLEALDSLFVGTTLRSRDFR